MERGDFAQATVLVEEALSGFEHQDSQADQAELLHMLGSAYNRGRDLDTAISVFQRCLTLRESLGDSKGVAATLNNLGSALVSKDDYAGAMASFQRSIALYQHVGDAVGEANALTNTAVLYKNIGDTATAIEMLHRGLRIYENAKEERRVGLALLNIASNYAVLEDADQTLRYAERGVKLLESVGDRYNAALALNMVGNAYVQMKRYDIALETYQRSLARLEEFKIASWLAMTHYDIGEVLIHMGRFNEANEAIQRSLDLRDQHEEPRANCEALTRHGQLYATSAFSGYNLETALQSYLGALKIAEELDATKQLIPIYAALSDIYEKLDDPKQALSFHRLLLQSEKRLFRDDSDQRIRNLQIRFDVEKAQQAVKAAEREAEIARLDAQLAQLHSNELADALAESDRLREIADAQSRRDGLTNVFNRRYMDEMIETECERSQRYNKPLAVALIDIDHFKKINDTFGHGIGDDALRMVARLLQENCRYGDIVARYGGEEFAVILPNTEAQTAYALCEQVRSIIENTEWERIVRGLRVTISVGISVASVSFPSSEERIVSPTVHLNVADKNLYAAKKAGRNRVII